jgi:hypothetical protein
VNISDGRRLADLELAATPTDEWMIGENLDDSFWDVSLNHRPASVRDRCRGRSLPPQPARWRGGMRPVDTAEVEVLPSSGTPTAAQLQTAVTNAVGGSTGGNGTSVSGIGSVALKAIAAVSATYALAVNSSIVIIAVFSQSNPGSAMDAGVQALAQSVAGQL